MLRNGGEAKAACSRIVAHSKSASAFEKDTNFFSKARGTVALLRAEIIPSIVAEGDTFEEGEQTVSVLAKTRIEGA